MSQSTPPQAPSQRTQPRIGELALAIALSKVGQHEDFDRKNQGDVVIEACRRWVHDANDWQELYDAGKMEWCAGFVCSLFDDAGSQVIKHIASTSCTSLHKKAKAFLVPLAEMRKGDILLTDRDLNGRPNHASIVEDVNPGEGRVYVVSGNSGPKSQYVHRHHYSLNDRALFAVIRVPA